MKKLLRLLVIFTILLVCICGCAQTPYEASVEPPAEASKEQIEAVTVSESEPEPEPSYVLDRSDISENVAVDLTMVSSDDPVTYEQVLDEAERQGSESDKIDLTAYCLSIPQIKDITARCVDREVLWQLTIDGVAITPSMTEADLSGHDLARLGIDLYEVFEMFPNLTWIDLSKTGFSNEQYAALQDAFPNIRMIWEIVWYDCWTFRTDVVAFSTQKGEQPFNITDEDAKYLKYCTDLVALDLGHNCVRDWSFLQYMPNLKILIAVDNRVADLSWIKYTPKLEYLEFFVGKITDLSFLQYTPNMVDLNISYNPERDATYLYNLPKLERLWMEHTRIPYSEFEKLQAAYPNAKIVYEGEGSIDQGWRENKRFYAIRDMFRKNYVHELFMD